MPPPLTPVYRGTLPGDGGGPWLELEGSVLRVGTADPAAVQGVLDALRRAGLVVRRLQPIRPSLEDLFMEAVGQQGGPIGAAMPGVGVGGLAAGNAVGAR